MLPQKGNEAVKRATTWENPDGFTSLFVNRESYPQETLRQCRSRMQSP